MTNDEKQIRKVARCIKTLLEAEGTKVAANKVMGYIQDKDLSNIPALKDEVVGAINDMRKSVKKSDRRKEIEEFCVANWDLIGQNETIRDILFNAYSQGRYSKEQKNQLKDELLAICNGEAEVIEDDETAMADDNNAELAANLMGGDLDF